MKVLLDECCPRPLRNSLSDVDVFTVEMTQLKGLKNGDLVNAVNGVFDVLVTADKNLRYQQNLAKRQIAIIELPFNSWKRLQPLIPALQQALTGIKPGDYMEIFPTPRII
jgi:hypothetical protein